MLISAWFADRGVPTEGLSPIVDVVDLSDGSLAVDGQAMTDRGKGFYIYEFDGYDSDKEYGVLCDSITLTYNERYAVGTMIIYGIAKNVALANYHFDMVLSADHVTSAIGKTVTAKVLLNDGNYALSTNSVVEVGDGTYRIDLTRAERNAATATYKFAALGCDTVTHTFVTP